ncbi:non-ribosomal peptide synthetase [Prauserella halophila]|uniref:Non-ribosomal peptide synthetase n=1 Tax=Prauserella halophila TaxID=185641 RepID=A0ABN1VZY3_9PSEU|nr:non-ribosomal peptide synthetase [Prauserella halophila]MCP2235308.1 non-ribosomal peptide synthase domain TIGR01720/amino acid adenylation domain-containing protein [Prauserella halophila]
MRSTEPTALPLTQAQSGVWIAQRLDPTNPIYTIAEYVDIAGAIDPAVLERALHRVVAEADALRVRFEDSDGATKQVVRSEVDFDLEVVDIGDTDDAPDRALAWMRRRQERPLDPGSGATFEFALLRLGPRRSIWYQRYHHSVLDGVGMTVIERRVAAVYSELAGGEPAGTDTEPAPLTTLLEGEADYRASAALTADEEYWAGELARAPEPTTLGAGHPSVPNRLERHTVRLGPEELARIRDLAREAEVGWPSVLVGALGTYLSRLTGADDMVLGIPAAARPSRHTRDVPGMASNIVPLRLRLPMTLTVGDLLTHTARQLRDVGRHQRYRYEDLRRSRKLLTDDARLTGPHVNLVLGDYTLEFAGVPATMTSLAGGPVDDLSLAVDARCEDGGVKLVFDANPELYSPDAVAAHAERFTALVRRLVEHEVTDPVANLTVATDEERELVLSAWNDTARPDPATTLVELLETQAAATPDAIAVTSGDTRLSYGLLHARAERLARALVRRGVGPETFVAVCLPRTAPLMVALLGVLKAGGAYLPVDPGYPDDRIELMLDDARPVLGLTSTGVDHTVARAGMPWLDLDEITEQDGDLESGPLSQSELLAPLRPEHAAYVIYTSGSTGRPKGVVVGHAAVAELMLWAKSDFGPDRLSEVLASTSLNFDVSVFEMFGPLCCGGHIELVRDLLALADRPDGWSGTLLSGVPSALAQLLTHGDTEIHADDLVLAGEGLSLGVAGRIQEAIPSGRLANIYGPTEATVYSTAWYADGPVDAAPPIGKPIRNTRTYVLDGALRPVPPGETGELYLAGEGLARGYLNRSALTAERFVADPYGPPGSRMYRTGDVVRWNAHGDIEYLGRSDHQVKVRGFRIEPSEIETVLARRDEIAEVAVLVREDQPGVRQLVAYVVPHDESDEAVVDSDELRRHVADSLPEYMVPAAFTALTRLPLDPNGKLDRKALPVPEYRSAGGGRAPATETERVLCELFASVLGVDEVGADDSFFDRGGDSIIAIQLVGKARRAGLTLTPRQVFTTKTAAELATLATTASVEETAAVEDVSAVGDLPLLPIAHWLRERGGPIDSVHQAVVVNTPAGATERDMSRTLQDVLEHHDALRLRMSPDWRPTVDPPGTASVREVLRHVDVPSGTDPAALLDEHSAVWRELSLADGVLLRAVWFDAGTDRTGLLLLVAHHLLVDGVSWRILLDDLGHAWRGEDPLPVGTSLRAFATALQDTDRSAELSLWHRQLATPDPDLGSRRFDPAVDTAGTARQWTFTVPGRQSAAVLQTVPATFATGPREVLLTALALALEHWRASRGGAAGGVLVDVEGHGREQLVPGADLSRTVGWFTALFPFGIDLDGIDVTEAIAGGPAAGTALKRVKQALADLPDNGAGFGALRYLDDRGAALAEHRPPQVGFNFLGRLDVGDEEWGLADRIPDAPTAPDTRLAHAVEINTFATPDDRVVVGVTSARGVLADDESDALMDVWQTAMSGLALHAESYGGSAVHTPSDFPLVRLDQSTVEELENEYGPRIDILPVTPLQRGLRFHALFDTEGSDVYTMQFTFDLTGDVDVPALRTALREVTRRHPNMLAAFPRPDLQVVPTGALPDAEFTEIDLSAHDAADRDAELERVLADDRARRFDLTRPPLLRMMVVHTGGRRSTLVLTNHHILLDGWSMPIVARELFALYSTDTPGLPPAARYADYLGWLLDQDPGRSERAWTEELAGLEEPTLLAPARGTPHARRPGRITTTLGTDDMAALTELARTHGLTLNTVVQGAWGVLLAALTGRTDVCFGATVSGRPADLAGVETMVGLLINTVPVRVEAGHDESITDVLTRLQSRQAGLMSHQHLGLAEIQRAVGMEELFDTLTVFENYPRDPAQLRAEGSGLGVTDIDGNDATHYPLTLVVTDGDVLELRLDYQPDLFGGDDAGMIMDRFRRVLSAFARDSHARIGTIDVLSADERRLVVHEFNDTDRPVTPTTLPAIFAEQAARTPDRPALMFDERSVSYAELDAAANRLARHLIESGVSPGELVALAVPRSVELVVAMYAIHKAGGAYLPVDTDYPSERIAFMLDDARPALLITTADTELPATDLPTLLMDGEDAAAARERYSPDPVSDADRTEPLTPHHPAYVIYTSGSTGRPKGVMVGHRGIVNRLRWMQHTYRLDESDRVLQKTPAGFDVSVWEFFWPLQTGAALVVAEPEGHRDPLYLAELIDSARVTTVHFVPSMLHAFLESLPPDSCLGLRRVLCSGEALQPELVRRLSKRIDAGLHNLYGPTEASVDVTSWVCSADEPTVPIGRPVWNTRLYVLDGGLRHMPPGVSGELYIAGDQLASGYLGRPGLTAERFVPDPHGQPGERMYRTGDLARWRPDGALEYLGRGDDQVKIRGLRIEPGEIEEVLAEHDDVTAVTVLTREDAPGGRRLVAYVVGPAETDDLRKFADARLPEHMVPTGFVPLPELPLTPNGKLDRKALPAPDFAAGGGGRGAGTPMETALATLFAEVLGVPEVSAEDNFFDRGGDSIMSIQLASRAKQAGIGITPREVFQARTVADIAALARELDTTAMSEPADAGVGDVVPTPFAHWLLDEAGDIAGFHQSMVLTTPAGLTVDTLTSMIAALLDHHDALRMRIHRNELTDLDDDPDDTVWHAEITPRGTVSAANVLTHVAAGEHDPADAATALAEYARTARDELDPDSGRMARVVWFDAGADLPGRLLLVLHHLVVDGVSWRILTEDLARLWSGRDPLPVGTSYRSWGAVLTEQAVVRASELPVWLDQVATPDRRLGARAVDPDTDTTASARSVTVEASTSDTEMVLTELPALYRAGVQDVLLTALGLAIADWRGETGPTVVDVEGHGRADPAGTDTSRTVGWFTTSYPVRLDPLPPDGDPHAGGRLADTALKRVKEQLRALPGEGLGYGLLRRLNPDTAPTLANCPQPQVGFNYLGRIPAPGEPTAWEPAPENAGIGGGAGEGMCLPHALEITAVTRDAADGPRLSATWLYPAGVLEEHQVRGIADRWVAALSSLAAHAHDGGAGGLTPSDVMASLSQEDLESFEDELDIDPNTDWEM